MRHHLFIKYFYLNLNLRCLTVEAGRIARHPEHDFPFAHLGNPHSAIKSLTREVFKPRKRVEPDDDRLPF
jgi:hypothetical protein